MAIYNHFPTLPIASDTDIAAMAARIEHIFLSGTPELVAAGSRWYAERHQELKNISLMTDIPTEVLAWVTSALSPRTRWEDNRTALFETLNGFLNEDRSPVRSRTLYAANDAKAFRMLEAWFNGETVETIAAIVGKGQKTNNFAPNLLERDTLPNGETAATMDSISAQAATGLVPKNVRGGRYRRIAAAFAIVARKYGLPVYILQAIVWCVYRGTGN